MSTQLGSGLQRQAGSTLQPSVPGLIFGVAGQPMNIQEISLRNAKGRSGPAFGKARFKFLTGSNLVGNI